MSPRIGRTAPQDPVDEWIKASGLSSSFVDIGGIGEFATNERTSWAKQCGFKRVAMADLEGPDHHLWKYFDKEAEKVNFTDMERFYHINVDDPNLLEKIGKWEMLHSTGILYHVPNPVHTILNYIKAVESDLIINTVTIPRIIKNEEGTLEVPASGVLFLPSLTLPERAILGKHYKNKFNINIDDLAPTYQSQESAIMPYLTKDGTPSYYPYWWLFTVNAFEGAVRMLGMKLLDSWTWEDHAHFVWLRRP